MKRIAASLAALALSVGAAGLTVGITAQPAAAAGYQVPIRSGLPWPSGSYEPGWSDVNHNAFGTWRNKPVDVAITWPARTTWEDFTNSNPAYVAFQNKPFTTVFGIPPIPEGVGATMPNCANGSYNSRWTTFGNTFKNMGLGSSVIRLGWEFNGNWYAWGGTNSGSSPATFAACFRQIVTTVRAVAPNLKFDWTVNRGPSAGFNSAADVLAAYPGDAYVDIVGVDSYSHWGDWNAQVSATNQGLQYWLNFAVAHGKKLSVPEWGMLPHSDGGGGDHPADIQNMWNFFTANAANIAYEGYFNDWETYDSHVWSPPGEEATIVPQSSAKYLSLYSAGGTTPPTGSTYTINDTAVGTGANQVQYSTGWTPCSGNCTKSSDGSFRWTSTVNSTAQFSFTGNKFTLFGMKEPWAYIGTVSIDGGPAQDVDFYASSVSATTVQVYASAALTQGSHTVKLTMTNRKNSASTGGQSITFDRAVITTD